MDLEFCLRRTRLLWWESEACGLLLLWQLTMAEVVGLQRDLRGKEEHGKKKQRWCF